jgi:two-component system, OmpR family, response regulator
MRVLVVEDEAKIASFIVKGLAAAGYDAEHVTTGAEALERAAAADVMVLDLGLPDIDGIDVIEQLRGDGVDTQIIVLTARAELADRVTGLEHGADDYLAKPFAFEELVARVQALARRGPVYRGEPTELKVHDLVLDRATREVRRGERLIELTPREFALLECLMRAPGKVLSRALILEKVWGFSKHPLTNVVDVYIRQLRRKIDNDAPAALIQTVRGFGYKLRNP